MAQEDLLDVYTDYLICQNQHATATGLSQLLDGLISHGDTVKSCVLAIEHTLGLFF